MSRYEVSFSPTSLSGLQLDINPAIEASVTLVSSVVSAVADQSGVGNGCSQATAGSRFSYVRSGGLNNKAYLSGSAKTLSNTALVNTLTNATVFAVCRMAGDTQTPLGFTVGGVVNTGFALRRGTGVLQCRRLANDSAGAVPGIFRGYLIAGIVKSNFNQVFINGEPGVAETTAGTNGACNTYTIGAQTPAGSDAMAGEVYRALAWNREFNSDELATVGRYLADIYALPIRL